MADAPDRPLTAQEAAQVAANLARPTGEVGARVADWMETGNLPMVRSAQAVVSVRSGETVVEVGPGSGRLTVPLAQALGPKGTLHLVEHAEDMAQRASQNLSGPHMPTLHVHAGDWATADVASADAVLAVNVVYFVKELPSFASTCFQWLRPGGRLVLGIRSLETMKQLSVTKHGFILRPVDTYLHVLHQAGFVDIAASYHPEPPTERAGETHALDPVVLRAVRPRAQTVTTAP